MSRAAAERGSSVQALQAAPGATATSRVLVIGSGGAGKSTLSVRLGAALSLHVIHLDKLHWKPGWVASDKEAWRNGVRGLVEQAEWVMDGNYTGTLDLRIPAADVVVYMDFQPALCLWRVVKRRFMYRQGGRPDIAPGCPERLSFEFLKWIWTFRGHIRPKIMERLEASGADNKVVILKGPKDAEHFIGEVERLGRIPSQNPTASDSSTTP